MLMGPEQDVGEFSPFTALAGGGLIGLGAVVLMLGNGRIMGVAGMVGGLLREMPGRDGAWRLAFLTGMVAPAAWAGLAGVDLAGVGAPSPALPAVLAGGFLVGLGTRMGNGCTSGHGICGLARLSPRSAAAVGVFMATAAVTVFATRHLMGG
jgi:uncharacterized protein